MTCSSQLAIIYVTWNIRHIAIVYKAIVADAFLIGGGMLEHSVPTCPDCATCTSAWLTVSVCS